MFRIVLTFWISVYMHLSTKIRRHKDTRLSQIVESFFSVDVDFLISFGNTVFLLC